MHTQRQPDPSALSPAAKAALTRRRNGALAGAGAYGTLLRELWLAQQASDQAKSRAANGVHRLRLVSGGLAERNYWVSREARRRDYLAKEAHLSAACRLLLTMPWVRWGSQLAPQEYDALDCWCCFGTGQLTLCSQCGGAGIVITDEQCVACSGFCNLGLCDTCGGNDVRGGNDCCPRCRGAGHYNCQDCGGSGRRMLAEVECPECGGNGECEPVVCPRCGGSGLYRLRPRPRLYLLYVDLPTGQASFHRPARGVGPEYHWEWDGIVGATRERIVTAIDEMVARLREQVASRALVAWRQTA